MADLAERLHDLATRHRVPGASLAVLADGVVQEAAHGVLNTATGVDTTTDSLFQIGSITKVYTATLIMRLVQDGELGLDDSVVSVLPEFTVDDPDVTKEVTIRHLLCHSSGIDGDLFLDTGRGDECVERYVEAMATLAQNHPLGATMSYCNSGYVVLGRVVERVTGKGWDTALREMLLEPLGVTHTWTLPEEALRFRTAIGHIVKPDEAPVPAPLWGLMRSAGPAGLINATARDVIAFAQLHMRGGDPVLSGDSVAAMQQPQVAVPDRWTLGDHWGLGWILFTWDGRPVYGHDGGTIGQSAFLRVVPDAGVAIALLTNGGATGDLYQDLFRELLAEHAHLTMPARPAPPATPVAIDPSAYTGRYERTAARMDITPAAESNELVMTVTNTGPLAALVPNPSQTLPLVPVDPAQGLFVTRTEGTETWTPAVFFTLDSGARYLHFGARATPRVGNVDD